MWQNSSNSWASPSSRPGGTPKQVRRFQNDMRVVVVGIASTVPTGTQLPEWNLVMAAAMMALLPPVLVVICLQRWFVHGLLETEK